MKEKNNDNRDRERDLVIKILMSGSVFFILLAAILLEAAMQSNHLPSP